MRGCRFELLIVVIVQLFIYLSAYARSVENISGKFQDDNPRSEGYVKSYMLVYENLSNGKNIPVKCSLRNDCDKLYEISKNYSLGFWPLTLVVSRDSTLLEAYAKVEIENLSAPGKILLFNYANNVSKELQSFLLEKYEKMHTSEFLNQAECKNNVLRIYFKPSSAKTISLAYFIRENGKLFLITEYSTTTIPGKIEVDSSQMSFVKDDMLNVKFRLYSSKKIMGNEKMIGSLNLCENIFLPDTFSGDIPFSFKIENRSNVRAKFGVKKDGPLPR